MAQNAWQRNKRLLWVRGQINDNNSSHSEWVCLKYFRWYVITPWTWCWIFPLLPVAMFSSEPYTGSHTEGIFCSARVSMSESSAVAIWPASITFMQRFPLWTLMSSLSFIKQSLQPLLSHLYAAAIRLVEEDRCSVVPGFIFTPLGHWTVFIQGHSKYLLIFPSAIAIYNLPFPKIICELSFSR